MSKIKTNGHFYSDIMTEQINRDDIDFTGLCMNPGEIDMVLYHANCSDGFGSALSAYVYFKKTNGQNLNGNTVTYHPCQYGQNIPDVKDKNVLMCDFSYKSDIMNILMSNVKKLVILDHHKSAEADLKTIPETNKIFRMDHSGAYITWIYFNRTGDVPSAIKYIEDNDIWKKALPYTREVTAYIYSLPFEFKEYEKLLEKEYIENFAINAGMGMVKQNDVYIKQAMSHCTPKFMALGDKYYLVVNVNSTVLKSEIGNEALKKFPYSDFSAVYSQGEDDYYISLRSAEDRADVSIIASKFGGGGHACASGLSSKQNSPPLKYIGDYHIYNALSNIYIDKLVISQEVTYTIVYLNYCGNKHHIAKYLIQTRCISKNPEYKIQECYAIYKTLNSSNTLYFTCDVSAVWNYDGKTKKTWFNVAYVTSDAKSDAIIKDRLEELLKDNSSKYDEYKLCIMKLGTSFQNNFFDDNEYQSYLVKLEIMLNDNYLKQDCYRLCLDKLRLIKLETTLKNIFSKYDDYQLCNGYMVFTLPGFNSKL